jgi:hypothetical protein
MGQWSVQTQETDQRDVDCTPQRTKQVEMGEATQLIDILNGLPYYQLSIINILTFTTPLFQVFNDDCPARTTP